MCRVEKQQWLDGVVQLLASTSLAQPAVCGNAQHPHCLQERGLQRKTVASATDNATVSDFLDWLLPKLNGFGGGGAAADADAAAAADGGGYVSPDYSYSGSEGEEGEDVASGQAAMADSGDEAEEGGSGSEDEDMGEAMGDSGGC